MKNLTKTLILLSCFWGFSGPAFSNDFFIPKSMFLDEFPFPFQPVSIDVPDLVLNTIQNSDILFLGEIHTDSIFLKEKHSYQKTELNYYRLNSLNQENIYLNFIDRFSKIHEEAKKCLWIEFDSNDSNIENILKGLHPTTSHYYLINTAKEKGWKVFPVDNWSFVDRDNYGHADDDLRDQFMAKQIAQTISNGDCEKGIAQNGIAHLSGVVDYFQKNNLKFQTRDEYLNELVKIKLENLNLDKRIDFFIIEDWSDIQILRTKEDVLSAYKAGKRDFAGWNLRGAKLTESLLARADFQEANLKRAHLSFANLYKANLKLADLKMADLAGANLIIANLYKAKLNGADLRMADLKGAYLREANLQGAKLRMADLRRANFQEADLRGADLQEANLRRADFRNAYYNNQTLFPDHFNPKRRGMVFMSE